MSHHTHLLVDTIFFLKCPNYSVRKIAMRDIRVELLQIADG